MKRFYLALNILCSIGFAALIYAMMSAQYIRNDLVMIGHIDLYIPYISGYAFLQGLNNAEFLTSFGFIYGLINAFAFKFLDFFNLGLNKLIFTASLFFACSTIIVWALIRSLTKYKIPYIFLLLVLLLSINPISVFVFLDWHGGLSWTCLYNNNLWGLLCIQIALSLLIFKDRTCLKMLAVKDVYVLAFIEFLFLFLTFNYKPNFFICAFLLSAIIIPFLTYKNALRYIVCLIALFGISILLISLLTDYKYAAFYEMFKDLFVSRQKTMDNGMKRGLKLIKHFLYAPVIIVVIAACLNIEKIRTILKRPDGFILRIKSFISEIKSRAVLETFAFAFLFTLAVFIVIEGNTTDGARCFIIPVLLCFFTFWENKHKKLIFALCCAAYFLYIDAIFISAQALPKYGGDYKEVVLDNVNPKYRLKFFYKPQFNLIQSEINAKKLNIEITQVDLSQVFDEMIQMSEKFNLRAKEETILFVSKVNYVPFVLGQKFSLPAYPWLEFDYDEIENVDVYKKLITADILIKVKPPNYILLQYLAHEQGYAKVLEQMSEYKPFYETDNLLFYAKQEWIDKRIGKGSKLPIIDKKGRGDIVKTIAEAK